MEIVNAEHKNYLIKVHDNGCIGCQRHKKDIMVTLCPPPEKEKDIPDFMDIFLTTDQAERLIAGLMRAMDHNTENDKYS